DWSEALSPVPPSAAAGIQRPRGEAAPSAYLAALIAEAALSDPARYGAGEREEHERARRVAVWFAANAGTRRSKLRRARIAAHLGSSLGAELDVEGVDTVDRVLILCADHELNASTFAARVAASTGADLYACVAAALHTLSGGLHGGVSARVEALLRE